MYTFLLEVYVGTQVKSLRTVLAVMLSCAMFCERFVSNTAAFQSWECGCFFVVGSPFGFLLKERKRYVS